jgi:thiol-disulfide isomerase/thioredoxin
MKKTSLIISSILVLLITIILIEGCKVENNENDYLRKVLGELENIKYAAYSSKVYASAAYDTVKFKIFKRYTEEYDNMLDTTIGSLYIVTNQSESTKNSWIYDGQAISYIFWDENKIGIDSFKTNILPFRPIAPPFFNYTKSIIKYALETKDSISTEFKDFGDSIKFSLYIPKKTIEFFGKPYNTDNPFLSEDDEFSKYDIWINKSDNLPYKYRRNTPHSTSWEEIEDVEFNNKNIEDFKITDYLPKNFAIVQKGIPLQIKNDLIGKTAPEWTLRDADNNLISLGDLKSKILVIQFTGIGCGPCHASIPFVKQLIKDYEDKDFEFVGIETWSSNVEGIARYRNINEFNFKFLVSTKEVTNSYQANAVPVFYILDKDRVIRKVIFGYDKDNTDKEIRDFIDELI